MAWSCGEKPTEKKTLTKDELTLLKNTDNSCPIILFFLTRKTYIIYLSPSLLFFYPLGVILGSSFLLSVNDFLLKTCLKERSRILIGPCCATANLEAKWCKHSGDPGPEQSIPKISIDLRGGLLQVCGDWPHFFPQVLN